MARAALALLISAGPAACRWCQIESVKEDVHKDFSFSGDWRLDTCTTLSLDHGKCTEEECPHRVKFEDEEIIELADALHGNAGLTALSISSNQLTDESAKAIAEALRDNEALTDLYLQGNKITDEGAVALAEALQENVVLTKINLEHNAITDEGAQAMLEVLKSNTSGLEELHLTFNRVSNWLLSEISVENERSTQVEEATHGDEL